MPRRLEYLREKGGAVANNTNYFNYRARISSARARAGMRRSFIISAAAATAATGKKRLGNSITARSLTLCAQEERERVGRGRGVSSSARRLALLFAFNYLITPISIYRYIYTRVYVCAEAEKRRRLLRGEGEVGERVYKEVIAGRESSPDGYLAIFFSNITFLERGEMCRL